MENVENGVNQPLSNQIKAEFCDDDAWEVLCEKTKYILPKWEVEATDENIRLWLNRLEIREVDYREAMQTSIPDMIRMNPCWPLRSFVGLLLEHKFTS